ncbi:MAG: hypothetical protein HY659_04985 [Rhizobiales bacterium]|nr:hypothetical protein [Hyphomicrobiales bacterium]
MASIEEIRAEAIRRQAERRGGSMLPMIAGAVAAFFAGGVLVMGWGLAPALIAKFTPGGHGAGKSAIVAASAKRVGRADAAPILRACIPRQKFGLDPDSKIESAELYRMLKTGGMVARLSALGGIPQSAAEPLGLAMMWGEVADCVYRQNSWALCDADNRALAIEATNTFVRQLRITSGQRHEDEFSRMLARVQASDRRAFEHEMQSLRARADRVLSGLRHKVTEGRLVTSDFGFAAAPEVKEVLNATKSARNACADEGR